MFGAGVNFPSRAARVPDTHHDREGRRRRALGILTAETAVVDKPTDEEDHEHHHGHAH